MAASLRERPHVKRGLQNGIDLHLAVTLARDSLPGIPVPQSVLFAHDARGNVVLNSHAFFLLDAAGCAAEERVLYI